MCDMRFLIILYCSVLTSDLHSLSENWRHLLQSPKDLRATMEADSPPLSPLKAIFTFQSREAPPHSYRELFSPRVPLFHCVPTKLNGISLSTLFWLWLIVWDMIFRSSSWGKVDQGGRSKVSDTKFNGSEYLEPDCSTFVCTKLITIWLLHHTQLCKIFYIGWHADRKVNENGN